MTDKKWVGDARRLAANALLRIEEGGAYANLVLPPLLDRSKLEARDRAFATELTYGTTRMRRACDWLVDRFLLREVEVPVRIALRLGAYQLHFLGVAPHAAVSATVDIAPPKARGLVTAVLRRVADNPVEWPDVATRLSYPDHVVAQLSADLGVDAAVAALEAMNVAPEVTQRADGYVQDLASQWVAELVEGEADARVLDLCAAPGGKTTALAGTGTWVAAGDVTPARVRLIAGNAARIGVNDRISPLVADARRPPFAPSTFDRVLLDAPCSGLGVLRRRADARWRVDEHAPNRLSSLQRALASAAVDLVRPGGLFVYSVCTLTSAETLRIDEHLVAKHPELEPLPAPAAPWQPHGRGALLLPQAAGTDGMYVLRLRRP